MSDMMSKYSTEVFVAAYKHGERFWLCLTKDGSDTLLPFNDLDTALGAAEDARKQGSWDEVTVLVEIVRFTDEEEG
jgi:hypothetical protein